MKTYTVIWDEINEPGIVLEYVSNYRSTKRMAYFKCVWGTTLKDAWIKYKFYLNEPSSQRWLYYCIEPRSCESLDILYEISEEKLLNLIKLEELTKQL